MNKNTHVIRARKYFYGPKETVSYLARGTLKQCKDLIESYDSQIYYLDHGEHSRPTYRIVKLDNLGPNVRREAEYAWTIDQLSENQNISDHV